MGKKEPKGIGGWFLIPFVILIASVIVYTLAFVGSILAPQIWEEAIAYLMVGGISYYALFLTLKKHKKAITWLIVWLWAGALLNIYLGYLNQDYAGGLAGIVGAIIWHSYLDKSKRVKNTFNS